MRVTLQYRAQIEAYNGRLRVTWPEGTQWFEGATLVDAKRLAVVCGFANPLELDDAITAIVEIAVGTTRAEAAATIRSLLNVGLLRTVPEDEPAKVDEIASLWRSYGWEDAFQYHLTSESAERIDYRTSQGLREDIERMKKYISTSEPPSEFLDLPSLIEEFPLPSARKGLRAQDALSLNVGAGAANPLSLAELSTVLFYSLAVTGTKRLPVTGEHPRKVVPSGGSRHPTEALIILEDPLDYLPAGFFHYDSHGHSLRLIDDDVPTGWVQRNVLEIDNWVDFAPRATVILFSYMHRNRYRYRENFTYRPVHHDVGHAMEQLSLMIRSLGRRQFGGYSLAVEPFAERLRLDCLEAPAMAFVVLE